MFGGGSLRGPLANGEQNCQCSSHMLQYGPFTTLSCNPVWGRERHDSEGVKHWRGACPQEKIILLRLRLTFIKLLFCTYLLGTILGTLHGSHLFPTIPSEICASIIPILRSRPLKLKEINLLRDMQQVSGRAWIQSQAATPKPMPPSEQGLGA